MDKVEYTSEQVAAILDAVCGHYAYGELVRLYFFGGAVRPADAEYYRDHGVTPEHVARVIGEFRAHFESAWGQPLDESRLEAAQRELTEAVDLEAIEAQHREERFVVAWAAIDAFTCHFLGLNLLEEAEAEEMVGRCRWVGVKVADLADARDEQGPADPGEAEAVHKSYAYLRDVLGLTEPSSEEGDSTSTLTEE